MKPADERVLSPSLLGPLRNLALLGVLAGGTLVMGTDINGFDGEDFIETCIYYYWPYEPEACLACVDEGVEYCNDNVDSWYQAQYADITALYAQCIINGGGLECRTYKNGAIAELQGVEEQEYGFCSAYGSTYGDWCTGE
jgi:hypothetical protein